MENMLVVEDDILSQKMMIRIFKNDYNVDVCDSAEEYYEKYSSNNYAIIIMDISIKGSKHGLDLIKEIKAPPSYTGTPILCLTAHAQAKMRSEAIESGSDFFITKPVPNRVLKDTVKRLTKVG